MLFIPCQAGRFYDFENFHMDDVFRPYIDAGEIMVFSIDTIDNETWADHGGNPRARIEQHERWFNYIVDEMVPQIRHLAASATGVRCRSCHSAVRWARCTRRTCSSAVRISLTACWRSPGVYDSFDSFGDYMDDLVYRNSPYHYLSGMSEDHPYIRMYNERKIILCVGQGAWEDVLKESTSRIKGVLDAKGIHAWVDFWGYDVDHDWGWWYKQVEYYLPFLLGKR